MKLFKLFSVMETFSLFLGSLTQIFLPPPVFFFCFSPGVFLEPVFIYSFHSLLPITRDFLHLQDIFLKIMFHFSYAVMYLCSQFWLK